MYCAGLAATSRSVPLAAKRKGESSAAGRARASPVQAEARNSGKNFPTAYATHVSARDARRRETLGTSIAVPQPLLEAMHEFRDARAGIPRRPSCRSDYPTTCTRENDDAEDHRAEGDHAQREPARDEKRDQADETESKHDATAPELMPHIAFFRATLHTAREAGIVRVQVALDLLEDLLLAIRKRHSKEMIGRCSAASPRVAVLCS